MEASALYIKQVSGLLKVGVTTLRSTSTNEAPQETYSCQLRIKSSPEDDVVPMQLGSGDTHLFFPDSLGDDLIIDVPDSKGNSCGRVVAQVATIADDSADKLCRWSIYREPEHELVGRIQLYIHYTTAADESNMKVTKINRFHKQINGNDKVTLTFNLSANLESLFTWNTKQVFVFLTAEYENSKNSLNQVSLWDHIIPVKDHANLQLEVKSKYPLIDQGRSLRGKKVRLVLHWHVMPKAGAMVRDRMALSEFKLPDAYTS